MGLLEKLHLKPATLESSDPDERAAAAEALGNSGDASAADALVAAFEREQEEVVRLQIKRAVLTLSLAVNERFLTTLREGGDQRAAREASEHVKAAVERVSSDEAEQPPQPSSVEFDAEGKVSKVDVPAGEWAVEQRGQTHYCTQQAPSLLHATEMLKAVLSVPELTYYIVETPDGALCRDMLGFYTEGPIKTSGLTLHTSQPASDTVESLSLTAFGDAMKSQASVAQLKQQGNYANFILLMECGRCGYKSPVETQAGPMERECYCCGATNKTTRGTINVMLGSGMAEI
jgi:HEAT repeat protein